MRGDETMMGNDLGGGSDKGPEGIGEGGSRQMIANCMKKNETIGNKKELQKMR